VLTSRRSRPPSRRGTRSLRSPGKARRRARRADAHRGARSYAGLGRRIVDRLFARAKIEYADDK